MAQGWRGGYGRAPKLDEADGRARALPVGEGMLIIFDPSIWYTTGPVDSVMGAKTLPDALNHWLARWGKELPGAEVRAVFSGTFCQEFDSTQEFLHWASRQ